MKKLILLLLVLFAAVVYSQVETPKVKYQTLEYTTTGWFGATIERAWLTDKNTFIVQYRESSNLAFRTQLAPYKIWRDVYEVIDGQIVLTRTIDAVVIPAQPSRVEFPEEEK